MSTTLLEATGLSVAFGRLQVLDGVDVHVAAGEMRPVDTRMAAMDIISPILLAALHQRELGGAGCNPLDAAAHATHVADGFVAAYAKR